MKEEKELVNGRNMKANEHITAVCDCNNEWAIVLKIYKVNKKAVALKMTGH